MKTWSYEEEVVVAKHYKKHIENYRSRKPSWKLVAEIMNDPLITHSEDDVKCRIRNFIALDEKAFLVGFTNASKQTQFLFKEIVQSNEDIGFDSFVKILVNTESFQKAYKNPKGMDPAHLFGVVMGMLPYVLPTILEELETKHNLPKRYVEKNWTSVIRDALWWPLSDIEEYK